MPFGSSSPSSDSLDFTVVWHATAAALAVAVRKMGRGAGQRAYTFLLPPGMLGGLYSACVFEAEAGCVHRLLLSYMQPALLAWDLKPLDDAWRALRIPTVDGRVELGRNTGDVLFYFLPSVGEKDSAAVAENRRQRSYVEWIRAASTFAGAPLALCFPASAERQRVACASRGRQHFLFRLDGAGGRTPQGAKDALGAGDATEMAPDAPLCRDILGEWKER